MQVPRGRQLSLAELGHSPKHSNNDIKIAKQSNESDVCRASQVASVRCIPNEFVVTFERCHNPKKKKRKKLLIM